MSSCCPVIELRQYTLRPGQRDVLVELFDRQFVESQEALGMRIVGQFRDLDRADRFVWLRGFADMDSRRAALESLLRRPGLEATQRRSQRDDAGDRRRAPPPTTAPDDRVR